MIALDVIIAPAVEPVSVEEVMTHCRIDQSGLDDQLTALIKAARTAAERITRRAIITQTLELKLDAFPCGPVYLPKPKLQSVASITYVDVDGVPQTWASDQYRVDSASEPARITPAYGVSWPSTRCQTGAVAVRYVAGYGVAADVPEGIKLWIKARIKHFYDNPGPVQVGGQVAEFPRSFVDGLLDDFAVEGREWSL